jgi:hypothetical protein
MLSYKPITQSAFWVQASPFAHYFTTFTGIKDTAVASQYADGVRSRIFQLKGPKTLSEATLTSPFDPTKHYDIVDFWKKYGCEFITVQVTPVGCGDDPQPIGTRSIIIPDAQITSLSFGAVDRTSSDASVISLTFVMDTFTFS